MIILARPISRDGEINLKGHLLEASARKISRTARRTLAGESIALANAIDCSLWVQAMLVELFLGIAPSMHLNSSDPLPLNTPFQVYRPSADGMDVVSMKKDAPNDAILSTVDSEAPSSIKKRMNPMPHARSLSLSDDISCDSTQESGHRENKLRPFDSRFTPSGKVPLAVDSTSARDYMGPKCGLISPDSSAMHSFGQEWFPVAFSESNVVYSVDSHCGYPASCVSADSHGSFDENSCGRVQFLSRVHTDSGGSRKTTSFLAVMRREVVMLTCDECSLWTAIRCAKLSSDFRRIFRTSKSGSDFSRLVSLTDCANAYSSVLAIQPKSICKLTKVNLCFIRGSM